PTAELTATPTPLPTAVTRPMDAAFLKNTTELVDFLETVDMKYHPYMDFIRFTTVLSSDVYII
ncbi:MAG: hypothetical protein IJO48_03150, partial [Clostridia bacterium]|nr:hypothetical protein [Clostridia bacterium]